MSIMKGISHRGIIKAHVRDVLEQHEKILELINDTDYIAKHPNFFDASIAAHFRHSLDHFRKAMQPSSETRNYDIRHRDTQIESSRTAALAETRCIRGVLEGIPLGTSEFWDKEVNVCFIGIAETNNSYEISSTNEREMSFVAHHATHHLAMIKAMLAQSGSIAVGGIEKVGFSNSTQIFKKI